VVAAVLLAGSIPARAQTTGARRAPLGLFSGADDRRATHVLNFSLSVVEANGSDVPAELRGVGPGDELLEESTTLDGYSTMLNGKTEYRWQGSGVQVGAVAGSSIRYYSQLGAIRSVSHTAALGVSARLGARSMLFANQTAAYRPSYLYTLFPRDPISSPGDGVPSGLDYSISHSESYSYGTTMTLTHGLSRRTHLSATGEFQRTDFLQASAERPDLRYAGVRGELSRGLTRNTRLTIRYGYRAGQFEIGSDAIGLQTNSAAAEHQVGFGLEHARPLSATRRMVMAFSLGSSAVSIRDQDPGTLYRLSGDVSIAWPFTATWQARGTFRRGLEYVAELSSPVFADGFTADVIGVVTSRLEVLAQGRYSSGRSVLFSDPTTLETYGADLQARYALRRGVALYAEYLHYFYDFAADARLSAQVPRRLESNGVRVGVTLWVPALRR